MTSRINPKNDFVFQRIFGREENKDILLSFLNAVLKTSWEKKLTDIEILKSNLDKERIGEKNAILDICARTAEGMQINIEVQLANKYNMEKRTLYYWSRLYCSQLPSGENYRNMKKTITINILDFEYINIDYFHSVFHIREDKTNYLLTDVFEVHFIELPKLYKENADVEDPLVDWMLFLKGVSDETLEVLAMKEPAIKKAWTVLEILSMDEEAMRLYELREKALHDEVSMLNGARDEGKKEVALKLLSKGMDTAFVSETTGLPEADIIELKGNLN